MPKSGAKFRSESITGLYVHKATHTYIAPWRSAKQTTGIEHAIQTTRFNLEIRSLVFSALAWVTF